MKTDAGKHLYVIAGSNGAGKTTFARSFLPKYEQCIEFVNADMIAAGLSPFSADTVTAQAARLMITRVHELAVSGRDFAFETTLAGRGYVSFLRSAKQRGYTVELDFLWIPKVEMSIERVAERVRMGGHHIPEDVIRRRYHAGLRNLFQLYMPLVDKSNIVDNTKTEARLVATCIGGTFNVVDQVSFAQIAAAGGLTQ